VKIEIGKRAQRQVERADRWWRKHRPSASALFEREYEHALGMLLGMPTAGAPYPTRRRPSMRRLLLPRSQYHLYFCVERSDTVVVIHSLWGVRRGRGPKL
jgi:plasmid stabilization system protein ParE